MANFSALPLLLARYQGQNIYQLPVHIRVRPFLVGSAPVAPQVAHILASDFPTRCRALVTPVQCREERAQGATSPDASFETLALERYVTLDG